MEISNISNYRDLKFQRDALMRVRERERGGEGWWWWCGGGGMGSAVIRYYYRRFASSFK